MNIGKFHIKDNRIRHSVSASVAALSIAIALPVCKQAQAADTPGVGPDELAFSVENMDLSVDPRKDFYHYAAGGWLDRVERPATEASYSWPVVQGKRVTDQLMALVEKAVKDAPTAKKGSPTQLVGDFYSAYVDVDRRREQGMAPLQNELDRIAAISSLQDLSRYSGHMLGISGVQLLVVFGPEVDLTDNSIYSIYAGPGAAGLDTERDVYRADEEAPRRVAYRQYVHDLLTVAGYDAANAERVTGLVLDLETELDKAKLTDAEKRDFNRLNNPMTLTEVQALISGFDVSAYLAEVHIEPPEKIIVTDPAYLQALSKILEERPLQDFKDYAAFLLIDRYAGVLSPEFDEPERALKQAFTGVGTLPPLEERGLDQLKESLGQPLSQLFVKVNYDEDTRKKTYELIDYVVAAFIERVPTRDWLSEETKAEALAKLKGFDNRVGYPDLWIDYSGLEIVNDDPVANAMSIGKYEMHRTLAKFGKPVQQDDFSGETTLPAVINASYGVLDNGFQITAAISQAPAFEPNADPAVRFCRFGAVIGHEATHGFDSTGRLFDAKGNLRNWWTEQDAEAFKVEAQKLIDQTANTELVEGHVGNGAYWAGENMADVGGIKLGYSALMDYLEDHPDENVEIDGLTQAQRCFIAWAQLWAENATDEYLINVAESANHPPNVYRAVAPLQHFDAFYETFGIQEGDPMWLPPEQRVNAW